MKRTLVTALQRRILNPLVKPFAGRVPGWILLETKGRRTGQRHRVPVGAVRDGDAVFIVSEHGRSSGYVRNIEADPRVRVRVGGRWHTGLATIEDELDPEVVLERQTRLNAIPNRMAGTDHLVVCIELDRTG